MRKKLIAANWKMNGGLVANRELVQAVLEGAPADTSNVVLCVPFPYLAQVESLLRGSTIALGAQNSSEFGPGAYTGEVEAGMLAELGCSYVILGHSERRALFGETDEKVAAKVVKALEAGLRPIACVGESESEHAAGKTMGVVERQLAAILDVVPDAGVASLVVAYEPVWAIGSGRSASPEGAQEVHSHVRKLLRVRFGKNADEMPILYGGSVKSANARALFAQPDIDGGLIGGASLIAGDFLAICAAAGFVN